MTHYLRRPISPFLILLLAAAALATVILIGLPESTAKLAEATDAAGEPAPETPPGDTAATPPEPDYVRVVGVFPFPGSLLDEDIVVFFDRPMVWPGGEGAGAPANFTPPLDGTFIVEDNHLHFLLKGKPSRTVVLMELSDAIRSAAGQMIHPDDRNYGFPTAPLTPVGCGFIDERDDGVRFGLIFPYAVPELAVTQAFSVRTKAGEAVAWQLLEQNAGTHFTFLLQDVPSWPLRVGLEAGLEDSTGFSHLEKPWAVNEYGPEVVSQGPRRVQGVDWGRFIRGLSGLRRSGLNAPRIDWGRYTAEWQHIVIRFSEDVDWAELAPRLKIHDENSGNELGFEEVSEGQRRNHEFRIALDNPGQATVRVTISEGLLSASGHVLRKQFVGTLERHQRDATVTHTWWGNDDQGGKRLTVSLNAPVRRFVDKEILGQHFSISPELDGLELFLGRSTQRFEVCGEWDSERTYEFTLKAGLPYDEGAVLVNDLKHRVTAPKIGAYAAFGYEDRYYFLRRQGMAIDLKSRNVRDADIELYRLFPSNLVVSLEDMANEYRVPNFERRWCELVDTEKVSIDAPEDRLTETRLSMDRLFSHGKRGVFCLRVNPKRKAGESSRYFDRYKGHKVVLFTDIGVLAHWRNDALSLFAHDLVSLAPLASARVSVYSSKNQLLGAAVTGADGTVCLDGLDPGLGTPRVAVVEAGDDFTFLELEARQEDQRHLEDTADPYNRDAYQAYLYADRDLYRPGETAHLRWIVRDGDGKALGGVPLKIKVKKPAGQVLFEGPTTLSEWGAGGIEVATRKADPTGRYTAVLLVPGEDKVVGSYTFKVEEFVPNRTKATVAVAEKFWRPGKKYAIDVAAEHLSGGPAANRKAETLVRFHPAAHIWDAWKDYTFSNTADYPGDRISVGTAQTNAEGKAHFEFSYKPSDKTTCPLEASVYAEVFELGGRSVAAKDSAVYFPSEVAPGLMIEAPRDRRQITVHAAAVAPDGSPAAAETIEVTLEQRVWSYYMRRYYSNTRPHWEEDFEPVETHTVPLVDGKGSVPFDVQSYGQYRIRVQCGDAPQFATKTFYCYGDFCSVSDAAAPTLIEARLDKARYNVGETAALNLEAPFDGKAVVVVQHQDIEEMHVVALEAGRGSLAIAVRPEFFPNVWVEVTGIYRPEEGSPITHPYSGFVAVNLDVEDPARQLSVAFAPLPEAMRPAAPMAVRVAVSDAAGNPLRAGLTLAAVDEGIHGITNYANPEPYTWFSRTRRPNLLRAHYYDKVAYDYEKMSPGGDRLLELAKRAVPPLDNWIKPVALWTGEVFTNEQGVADVTLELPEFTGQLRLVAVAWNDAATGVAADAIYVRRDHMLQTSMPRFMLPGDEARCRATLYNRTDGPCNAIVSWAVSGTLRATNESNEVYLAPRAEASFLVPVHAESTGQGQIVWEAIFADTAGAELERVRKEAPLPVNPPAAFQTRHETRYVKPGEVLELANADFVEDASFEAALTVTANPLWQLRPALQYLVGYPHGCVEQTTSRCLPMYLLRQYEDLAGAALGDVGRLDGYLAAGIDRLFAMQTSSGGLGGWPGAKRAYPYGSVYALHFLTLVKEGRQIALPEGAFGALQRYVKRLLRQDAASNSNRFLNAYAIFVLAMDGDLEAIEEVSRFDDMAMPEAARHLLAAALVQRPEDQRRAQLYLKQRPMKGWEDKEQSGTLSSPPRNQAIRFMVLAKIGTPIEDLANEAQPLLDFLRHKRYGTTQERALVITALSAYLGRLTDSEVPAGAVVDVDGKAHEVRADAPFSAKGLDHLDGIAIRNTGERAVFANITCQGIPKEAATKAEAKGITLTRKLLTAKGEPHTGPVSQTGTYLVRLDLKSTHDRENVVLVDMLPAGFEIVNTRLEDSALPAKLAGKCLPASFVDLRDDRVILAFDRLPHGNKSYFYAVRAVTPGRYQQPRAVAECMYAPETRGASKSEIVNVE